MSNIKCIKITGELRTGPNILKWHKQHVETFEWKMSLKTIVSSKV
jgi:hypothetical protein